MPVLSKNQKRLRAVNKKIRLAKPDSGEWNLSKIESLEKERDMISDLILVEQKKAKEKEDFKKMTADEAIEYFKEEKQDKIENHSIPNTPETRRLRKKVLQNLNEHMMSEMMNQQMRTKINIINQLKANIELEKGKQQHQQQQQQQQHQQHQQQEFFEVKKIIQNNFTS
jgi:hypothetical protein